MRKVQGRGRKGRPEKRKIKKYGQTNFKHSPFGIRSCILSMLALGILVGILAMAFVYRGQVYSIIGGFAVIAIVLAALGFYAGVRGVRERERKKRSGIFGILVSGITLIIFASIYFGAL
ncbi:MAG: DUF6142 family protein [Lachnospiraceae bacterium]|nr:DUF6142 family protein [Lachnospiraceae bacterium]